MKSVILRMLVGIPALALLLAAAPSARACAVCTGNPESPLAQGAQQGILVMLVVTYVVLFGMGAMFACVVVRARHRRHEPTRPRLTATPCPEREAEDHAEIEYGPARRS